MAEREYEKVRQERIAKGMALVDTTDNSLSRLVDLKAMDFTTFNKERYAKRQQLEKWLDKQIELNAGSVNSQKGFSVLVYSDWVGCMGGDRKSLVQRYQDRGLQVDWQARHIKTPGSINIGELVYDFTFRRKN